MLTLWKMIEKSLLLKDSSSSPSSPNSNAFSKILPLTNLQSKATDRWNQLNLCYFNLYLDTKVHGIGKVILVTENVYYKNIMLFMQHIWNLVTFKGAALVKTNIFILLKKSAIKWYISELAKFNCNMLNNNLNMKNWINMLFQRFKVFISIVLGLLTNETYLFDNAHHCQPLAQYMQAIMQYKIGYNISNISN